MRKADVQRLPQSFLDACRAARDLVKVTQGLFVDGNTASVVIGRGGGNLAEVNASCESQRFDNRTHFIDIFNQWIRKSSDIGDLFGVIQIETRIDRHGVDLARLWIDNDTAGHLRM